MQAGDAAVLRKRVQKNVDRVEQLEKLRERLAPGDFQAIGSQSLRLKACRHRSADIRQFTMLDYDQQSRAGYYLVSVRGRSYEFKLPDGARPGDLLRMVYVSDNPRPTFALLRIERAIDPAEAKLSNAGKLLAMLRGMQSEAADEPYAGTAAPLFPSRVPETAQAATLLHTNLFLSIRLCCWSCILH